MKISSWGCRPTAWLIPSALLVLGMSATVDHRPTKRSAPACASASELATASNGGSPQAPVFGSPNHPGGDGSTGDSRYESH